MSDDDFFESEFEQAQIDQLYQNDARRILTKVRDAQKQPELSGPRWPFELLQNAHDPGPRPGRSTIKVTLDCRGGQVIFEHDSKPFSARDLAALLSGGSGKEYESDDTTGRFGTGFLSTHVLSTRVEISGTLQSSKGPGQFELLIERDGDEPDIVRNIVACKTSIRGAKRVADIDPLPSARFLYREPERTIVTRGLESLQQVLPYLFSTCENLGDVVIYTPDGEVERWTASEPRIHDCAGGFVRERVVEVRGARNADYRSLRVTAREDAPAAALLLAERMESTWRVVIPKASDPRVFRRFPVRPSDFLQTALVVDAPLDLDQERKHVHLRDRDGEHTRNRALAREALDAWRFALVFAFQREWLDRHHMTRLALSDKSFAGETGNQGFWREELEDLAKRVACMPLVDVEMEDHCYLRATADREGSAWADFPRPRLSDASSIVIDTDRFWAVMNDVQALWPPARSTARDWSSIADEWQELGVDVRLVTLETMAVEASKGAKAMAEMPLVVDNKRLWIARFLDLVGECWARGDGGGTDILKGLLPDQHGRLRAPGELSRDSGIAESLKETALMLGIDLRAKLLDRDIEAAAAEQKLSHCSVAISRAVPGTLDEDKVVEQCLGQLERALVPGKPLPSNGLQWLRGSIRLLDHIWRSKRVEGRSLVLRCPLVPSEGSVVRWSGEPAATMMAPVHAWHEAARPFAAVYDKGRVFHPDYHGDAAAGVPDVVPALVKWGAAHPDPHITESPQKVDAERLQAIAESSGDAADVFVSDVQFSQIAQLHQILPVAQRDKDRATALLALVLRYVALHDARWRHFEPVRGRKKGGGDVDIRIRKALWLAHLRTQSWVPSAIEDGGIVKVTPVPATPATLWHFLEGNPEWLKENEAAIALLSECFGFDQLDVRLLGVTSDNDARRQIRSDLARLVEVTGAEPGALQKLANEVQEKQARQARVARSRNIGLAVQKAIGLSLEEQGLHTKLIDHGYDYKVSLHSEEETGDGDLDLKITIGHSCFIEVKSTQTGEVRLTPKQAETAGKEQHRYVLCVVDLRGETPETLDREWTAEEVEPLTRMMSDIGRHAEATWELVTAARSSDVGIRNAEDLRYGVPEALWGQGVPIAQWVAGFVQAQVVPAPEAEAEGAQVEETVTAEEVGG